MHEDDDNIITFTLPKHIYIVVSQYTHHIVRLITSYFVQFHRNDSINSIDRIIIIIIYETVGRESKICNNTNMQTCTQSF